MSKIRVYARPILVSIGLVVCAASSQASNTIPPGHMLLTTQPFTFYEFFGFAGLNSVELEGVPLGSFDFGSGLVATGNADTIVERHATASVASSTIPIEIVALELRSIDPIDIGNGPEFLSLTLNFDAGSAMTINGLATEANPHGTFDSNFHYFFDVFGSISGYLGTLETTTSQTGAGWKHVSNVTEPHIAGVNSLLNGSTTDNDFWFTETADHLFATGGHHFLSDGELPSVPSVSILGGGVLCLGLMNAGLRLLRREKISQCCVS
jgi:hypothetical protein